MAGRPARAALPAMVLLSMKADPAAPAGAPVTAAEHAACDLASANPNRCKPDST